MDQQFEGESTCTHWVKQESACSKSPSLVRACWLSRGNAGESILLSDSGPHLSIWRAPGLVCLTPYNTRPHRQAWVQPQGLPFCLTLDPMYQLCSGPDYLASIHSPCLLRALCLPGLGTLGCICVIPLQTQGSRKLHLPGPTLPTGDGTGSCLAHFLGTLEVELPSTYKSGDITLTYSFWFLETRKLRTVQCTQALAPFALEPGYLALLVTVTCDSQHQDYHISAHFLIK